MRYFIVAGGGLVGAAWLAFAVVIWQTRPVIWLTALPAGLVSAALISMYLHWPAVQHERQAHATDIEMLKTRAYYLAEERKPAAEREPLTVDAEAERRFLWNKFWFDCLQYAADNNSFSFRGCFENVLRWEDWRHMFAAPLVKAKWLEPIQASIKTKPMPGWTPVLMLRELGSGSPPPYPEGEPPEWKQTPTQNTANVSENTQLASEHNSPGVRGAGR